jgi:acetylornithine/succinyldiaminopimelate/putrescine aminotransferase
VFFCNSGTEANEAAIKFARLFGENRTDIITAVGGFHGRTYGSMSASGQLKLWQGFFPLAPGFKYVPYNDLEAIENSITRNTCAIMIEPIQGENGIVVPSNGYLKGIGKICKENNLLLIIDEVQSGIGKTGKLFAYQWEDIKPDIIATAKGIANGLPLGAVICSKKISEIIKPGMHGSTFGGNPISVTAAIEVMNLLDDHTLNKINNLSDYFLSQLKNINSSKIIDIRGKGLMLGIKFSDLIKASDIMLKLLDEGIISGTANDNVLRMLPPFVVSEDDILKFVDSLKKILN